MPPASLSFTDNVLENDSSIEMNEFKSVYSHQSKVKFKELYIKLLQSKIISYCK